MSTKEQTAPFAPLFTIMAEGGIGKKPSHSVVKIVRGGERGQIEKEVVIRRYYGKGSEQKAEALLDGIMFALADVGKAAETATAMPPHYLKALERIVDDSTGLDAVYKEDIQEIFDWLKANKGAVSPPIDTSQVTSLTQKGHIVTLDCSRCDDPAAAVEYAKKLTAQLAEYMGKDYGR